MFRNIKWVALLTFTLGYLVAAATAAVGPRPAPSGIAPAALTPINETGEAKANFQPAELTAELPAAFNATKANVLNRPESLAGVFSILTNQERALRVLHLGDSHVAGNSYPQAVRSTLEKAWGRAESDSAHNGVRFRYEGSNGATLSRFATEAWMTRIAAARPDLIILSFGTNECHGMGYSETAHRAQLKQFYAMLREACPDAVVMLTTPPGDYLTTRTTQTVRSGRGKKGRRISRSASRVNPMTTRCAAELERFASDEGLALWDLNSIAGSEQAAPNWRAASMMRPDRIHYTPEGYTLQGRLLGEAILSAYNNYIRS